MTWEMFINGVLTLTTLIGAISAYKLRRVDENKGNSEAAKNYAAAASEYANEVRQLRAEMAVMRVNSLQELKSKDEAYLTEKKETETKFKNEISSLNIQLESLRKQFLQSMIKTENLENQVRKLQEQVRNLGGIPVEYADINILGKEIN